jgi:hypothetical protein
VSVQPDGLLGCGDKHGPRLGVDGDLHVPGLGFQHGDKTVTATPTIGDLIVVVTVSTGVTTSAVTDNSSGTYVQAGAGTTQTAVWVRNGLITAATSTIFTATQTSSTGGGLEVFSLSGMSRVGSAAVENTGNATSITAGTTPTITMSGTADTTNPLVGVLKNLDTPTSNMTPPASWTESVDTGYLVPQVGVETVFINSGFASNTVTWGSVTATTAFVSLAELDSGVLGFRNKAKFDPIPFMQRSW